MIVFTGVSKTYGDSSALEETTFAFRAGATTVLIGPSGCGKSTMLRLMNGLIGPTTGAITIGGQALIPTTKLTLRQRMGYMIQDGGLFPHLTAGENVSLLAAFLKTPQDFLSKRILQLCELTHLDASILSRYPSELSGGQRQRVSLMRALVLDPPILLLDEPLAALDPMVRASLQQELKQIFSALKKTVILVTHDLHEAAYFADEIILMNKGTIEQTGSLSDLMASPATEFVSSFIAAQRGRIAV
jgi:osmoprotectant transport system ATP-binding protein